MKRLYIVVEGDTEEEFVKTLLRPHFQSFGVYSVDATKITTNRKLSKKGGFVNYEHLRNDIKRLLRQPDVIVSMFVDFYALPDSVPGYEAAKRKKGTEEQIKLLENAISEDIDNHRFMPYIQRHEFESLLFASPAGFAKYYEHQTDVMAGLFRIFDAFGNPEDINDGRETAPSKRILSIIPNYQKVVFGNIIALEIGLNTMLAKCPRFSDWLTRLAEKTTL
jgi:hypothetical protein